MSVRTLAAGAMLATIAAGALTVAVTQSGPIANASGTEPTSTSVGRAQPGSGHALDGLLGLTRSSGGRTYRVSGTYSAGSALTAVQR